MSEALWLGVLFGLGASLSIGPVFVSMIEESVIRGFKSGFQVIVGSAIADIIMLIPALLASWFLTKVSSASFFIGLIGASYFIYLGICSIRDARRIFTVRQTATYGARRSLWKGMIGNVINPATWTFWVVTGTPTMLKAYETSGFLGFACFMLAWFFTASGIETLISYTVSKTKKRIGVKGQSGFMLVSAITFFGIATLLMKDIIFTV